MEVNRRFREFLAISSMASLTESEYASPISTKHGGRTIGLWSGSCSRRHIEYVVVKQATLFDITHRSCSCRPSLSAILDISCGMILPARNSDFTDFHRATMDSGPNGDSFLAPRMLPDPDEVGDYHWPSYCRSPNTPIHPAGRGSQLP